MSAVTSSDIKMALAKRHGNREFFITECKTGPTLQGVLLFDGIAIYKSWSHPRIVGYEIKVSRSDFQRDIKFFGYLPYCHEFYLVVPVGLIDRMEIPNDVGLIYYNPNTGSLATKKKAIHRKIEISADMMLYIIMNRLESERLPFYSSKAEYFKAWLDNKIENRTLSQHVRNKFLDQIKDLERENARLKEYKEDQQELQHIIKIMQKHGINQWYNRHEALDKALSRPYPEEIDILRSQLASSILLIDKLKNRDDSMNKKDNAS
jgi:hypothetical protein